MIYQIYIIHIIWLILFLQVCVCARFTQSGIIAGLATAGWPGDTSLYRHCRCELKKKTCATFRLISILFLRVYDIVSMNLYSSIYVFIYISYIWLSDIILMTWEYLGDFRTSTLTSQVMQPQWISSRFLAAPPCQHIWRIGTPQSLASAVRPTSWRNFGTNFGTNMDKPMPSECHPNGISSHATDQTTHATACHGLSSATVWVRLFRILHRAFHGKMAWTKLDCNSDLLDSCNTW